jgi:hypothetical protein
MQAPTACWALAHRHLAPRAFIVQTLACKLPHLAQRVLFVQAALHKPWSARLDFIRARLPRPAHRAQHKGGRVFAILEVLSRHPQDLACLVQPGSFVPGAWRPRALCAPRVFSAWPACLLRHLAPSVSFVPTRVKSQ